ncbi:MAG: hypothetical protein ABII82_18850 [Verrucomicrobiota bacterium]
METTHFYNHSAIRLMEALGAAALLAAETGARRAYEQLQSGQRTGFRHRRNPGQETPLWNTLAAQLRDELREHGSKKRLADHLGIPPQRLSEFLSGRRKRLPDGEITLLLLHWLCERRAGRDPSLTLPRKPLGRPVKPADKN